MAAMEPQSDDGDIWWYICRLCHRAFAECTLRTIRTHIWTEHSSKDTENVLILSQSADLEPRVRILLSPRPQQRRERLGSTYYSTRTRSRTRGSDIVDIQRIQPDLPMLKQEPNGDPDIEPTSAAFSDFLRPRVKIRRNCKIMKTKSRKGAGSAPNADLDHDQALLPSQLLPETEEDPLGLNDESVEPESAIKKEVPDAEMLALDPYDDCNCMPMPDADWEPEPEIATNLTEDRSPSSPCNLLNENLGMSDSSSSSKNDVTTATVKPKLRKPRPHHDCQVCHICTKTFSCKQALMKHLRHIHAEEYGQDLLLKCSTCQKSCTSKKGHRRHQKAVHSAGAFAVVPWESRVTMNSNRCSVCSRVCATRGALLSHAKTHNTATLKNLCPDCGVLFKTTSGLREHQKIIHSSAKPYKCSQCDAAFKNADRLRRHSAVHVEGRPFLCSQCPSTFKTGPHLSDHVRLRHTRPNTAFVCRVCKAVFPGKTRLRSHELEVHDFQRGPTRYKCPFCPRQFAEECSLRVHLPKHSSERPYKCEFPGCGKTYKFAFHLKDHSTIHLAYDDLPYTCSLCGQRQRFGTTQQVRDHKRKVHGLMHEKRPQPQPTPKPLQQQQPTTAVVDVTHTTTTMVEPETEQLQLDTQRDLHDQILY